MILVVRMIIFGYSNFKHQHKSNNHFPENKKHMSNATYLANQKIIKK